MGWRVEPRLFYIFKRMPTVTWTPGSNPAMDQLFDQLREQQYQDREHRLWRNYAPDHFSFAVALTIHFDELGNPELCSSVALRDCWPSETYRILNRLWKVPGVRKEGAPGSMSGSFGLSAASQIEWLNTNTNYKLYFLSRETPNWENFAVRQFARFGIHFYRTEFLYLTCPNECDESCWQNIVYNGDSDILETWKRRLPNK
mgnify:CR=1 FL=1